LMFDPQ